MGKAVKLVAFVFRAINFFFDCLQTWQFTGGGGMSAVIATIIAWYQGLSYWALPIVAIIAGTVAILILALIFKAFTTKITEEKQLCRLPRLIYDMHKQVCTVRERLIKETNWATIERDKTILPMINFLVGKELDASVLSKLNEEAIAAMADKVKRTNGIMRSGLPLLDTLMKDSDVSLAIALTNNFRYRLLLARLDRYKPYPNDAINHDVQQITDASISFNNLILLKLLSRNSENIPFATLLATYLTNLPQERIMEIDIINQNIEKIMNVIIDVACSRLNIHIEDYLKQRFSK